MSARPLPEVLHGDWFVNEVMPQLFEQSRRTAVPAEEVALFVFASLSTILQAQGFTTAQLDALVRAHSITTHETPEALQ